MRIRKVCSCEQWGKSTRVFIVLLVKVKVQKSCSKQEKRKNVELNVRKHFYA